MEYKDQLIHNIECKLKSVLSKYTFQQNDDISNNKIKDDATKIVRKYLAYNNSNYVLKSGDIIVEKDEYDPSAVNFVFSDELKNVLYKSDKNIIE